MSDTKSIPADLVLRAIRELEALSENHEANVDDGEREGWHVGAVSYQRGLAAGLRTAADDLRGTLGL